MIREERIKLIMKCIADIPASNPMVVSFSSNTLSRLLSDQLIRKIAEVVVDEVEQWK